VKGETHTALSIFKRWMGKKSNPIWPHDTVPAASQGELTLGDGDGNPSADQQPIARIMIDLYSLDRLVTVKYLIPHGSELEPIFGRTPAEATGWRMLVDTLKRNLDEVVEIKERKWWRSEDARFRTGQRVRMVGDPNFPATATGTIGASPPPRRVRPGVVYYVHFDEPQINQHVGESYESADVLEESLQPIAE